MSRANLIALDAATGTPAAGFGTDGAVDVGTAYGGTPTIFENVAIIGAASGEVPQGPAGNPRAFDVRTGAKLWEFQTVPRAGEPFNETWGNGWENRGGTNMWAFAAPVDAQRGIAYLPIAGPAANYYGGDRPGNNAFANSIVAVDARTGTYRWHFQTVHHDLWDIDMPSAGGLFELERNGTRVPAIAQVGKSAYLYVLDRATGEPLIEVRETPVPQGDVPTEWYSPTQPIPVRPPPLARVSFSEADLVRPEDTTPAHAAACRDFMERSGGFYNAGPFTPFMYKAPDAPPKSNINVDLFLLPHLLGSVRACCLLHAPRVHQDGVGHPGAGDVSLRHHRVRPKRATATAKGTSFASPIVAGIAALTWQVEPRLASRAGRRGADPLGRPALRPWLEPVHGLRRGRRQGSRGAGAQVRRHLAARQGLRPPQRRARDRAPQGGQGPQRARSQGGRTRELRAARLARRRPQLRPLVSGRHRAFRKAVQLEGEKADVGAHRPAAGGTGNWGGTGLGQVRGLMGVGPTSRPARPRAPLPGPAAWRRPS